VLVIAETAWLLLDRVGAEAQLRYLDKIIAGEVEAVDLARADWLRIAEMVGACAHLRLDVVDVPTIG